MSVSRYDFREMPLSVKDLTLPATFHEDGTMTARPVITSIGVFKYRRADGSISKELRLPEEVFSEATMASYNNMPIYIGHKTRADGKMETDPNVINEWAVGRTANPIGNNVYVASDIRVEKPEGIRAMKQDGYQSFSVGYDCDMEESGGVWCGMEYDRIQRNIRGNHLSAVRIGRQGDQAILRMDSEDAILVDDAAVVAAEDKNSKEKEMANKRTIQLDSVDYEADEAVIDALKKVEARADSLDGELKAAGVEKSKLEAERDSYKAKFDAAEAELENMKKAHLDESAINARVAQRIVLVETAKKAGVEVKGDEADIDLKKAVIAKVYADVKLDGKDENYIAARFDCAVEDLPKMLAAGADATVRAVTAPVVKADSAEVNPAEAARQRMIDNLLNKGKKEGK